VNNSFPPYIKVQKGKSFEPTKQPITVALVNLADSQVVEWNIQMAGALIAALPTVIVYIFLGKYFLKGLFADSIKG
jgi:glucose/mannose transport system permease protein